MATKQPWYNQYAGQRTTTGGNWRGSLPPGTYSALDDAIDAESNLPSKRLQEYFDSGTVYTPQGTRTHPVSLSMPQGTVNPNYGGLGDKTRFYMDKANPPPLPPNNNVQRLQDAVDPWGNTYDFTKTADRRDARRTANIQEAMRSHNLSMEEAINAVDNLGYAGGQAATSSGPFVSSTVSKLTPEQLAENKKAYDARRAAGINKYLPNHAAVTDAAKRERAERQDRLRFRNSGPTMEEALSMAAAQGNEAAGRVLGQGIAANTARYGIDAETGARKYDTDARSKTAKEGFETQRYDTDARSQTAEKGFRSQENMQQGINQSQERQEDTRGAWGAYGTGNIPLPPGGLPMPGSRVGGAMGDTDRSKWVPGQKAPAGTDGTWGGIPLNEMSDQQWDAMMGDLYVSRVLNSKGVNPDNGLSPMDMLNGRPLYTYSNDELNAIRRGQRPGNTARDWGTQPIGPQGPPSRVADQMDGQQMPAGWNSMSPNQQMAWMDRQTQLELGRMNAPERLTPEERENAKTQRDIELGVPGAMQAASKKYGGSAAMSGPGMQPNQETGLLSQDQIGLALDRISQLPEGDREAAIQQLLRDVPREDLIEAYGKSVPYPWDTVAASGLSQPFLGNGILPMQARALMGGLPSAIASLMPRQDVARARVKNYQSRRSRLADMLGLTE